MAAFDKILFNKPNGTIFVQDLFKPHSTDSTSNRQALLQSAGIMTVAYIPVIGDCDYDARYGIGSPTKVSPFNASLSKLYIKLKGKAMTLGNYSAADVGKAMLALDSLHGLLAELDVDLNCLSEYCYNNVAKRGLIQNILWRDPITAQSNIANLIKRRNNIAAKMNVLPFIPGIKFLQDHIDWARFIYKDDNLDKSSLILFRRAGYYRWCCRVTDTYPGSLLLCDDTNGNGYSQINYSIIKAEDKFNILEMLLNDYTLDDDFTDLCAGIANAYGVDTDAYKIPTLPDDLSKFTLEFKYDLDVIDSLRSADFSFINRGFNGIQGIVEDSEGHLTYSDDFSSTPNNRFSVPALMTISGTSPEQYKSIDTGEGRVIFTYDDNPSSEAVDILVRYVHDYVHNALIDKSSRVFGLKSEYLTGISVWYIDTDKQYRHIDLYRFVDIGLPNSSTPFGSDRAECLCSSLISLPTIYKLIADGNGVYVGSLPHVTKKDIDNIGYMPRFANSTCSEEYMWSKFFTNNKSNNRKPKKHDGKPDENLENPK